MRRPLEVAELLLAEETMGRHCPNGKGGCSVARMVEDLADYAEVQYQTQGENDEFTICTFFLNDNADKVFSGVAKRATYAKSFDEPCFDTGKTIAFCRAIRALVTPGHGIVKE